MLENFGKVYFIIKYKHIGIKVQKCIIYFKILDLRLLFLSKRAVAGIEPTTFRTQSENHTARPNRQLSS
jgi:hypothetical protein